MRESALRPLADCGQTRVWNLLIDVIAQTGSYPDTATSLAQFQVGSERHYWQHVAIDRYTGQILDQSIEEVAEAPSDIVTISLTATPVQSQARRSEPSNCQRCQVARLLTV